MDVLKVPRINMKKEVPNQCLNIFLSIYEKQALTRVSLSAFHLIL